MKQFFLLACLLFLSVGQAAAQDVTSAAQALSRVRAAVGYERLRSQENGVVAQGTARFHGMDSKFTFMFTPDGRFRSEIDGPLGRTSGFNGATTWEVDSSGMPRTLELQDMEAEQFYAWIHSARWLAENGPFAVSLDAAKTDDKQVALKLALKGGLLEATLFVDRATWLPKSVKRLSFGGEEVIELSDYKEVLGFRFPHRLARSSRGVRSFFEIHSLVAVPATAAARKPFEPVTTKPADARWNKALPARVEVRRTESGHMLVHPLVNGKDVGWFILDTGAAAMVIDPKVADRLGMPALGETAAVGAFGMQKMRYRQGETFTLGRLTMTGTRYLEANLGFISDSLGLPIGGICGRDLFARAVVEIDIAAESVAIYEPASYRLEGATWRELFFSGRLPGVRARFEGDREGLFVLDTGSYMTLSIHAPTVERFKLLAGRETSESNSAGVGGSRTSRRGKLAWFELAGLKFDNLEVDFAGSGEGAFADNYTAGNIGVGILQAFRIIFDYPNKRIAFAKR
ncbi:MAG: retropepsin-like domain-containing protein [Pyrinomonadaceae bacterium]|nr:retropepsin-like domain-containing protein [Pyrinomonadaceae bacterium]